MTSTTYYAELIFGFEEPSDEMLDEEWLGEHFPSVRAYPTDSEGGDVAYGVCVGLDADGFPKKPQPAVLLELNKLVALVPNKPRLKCLSVIVGDNDIEIDRERYIPEEEEEEEEEEEDEEGEGDD